MSPIGADTIRRKELVRLALQIESRRGLTQKHSAGVNLLLRLEIVNLLGHPAGAEYQQTSRKRIQGAGMPDLQLSNLMVFLDDSTNQIDNVE